MNLASGDVDDEDQNSFTMKKFAGILSNQLLLLADECAILSEDLSKPGDDDDRLCNGVSKKKAGKRKTFNETRIVKVEVEGWVLQSGRRRRRRKKRRQKVRRQRNANVISSFGIRYCRKRDIVLVELGLHTQLKLVPQMITQPFLLMILMKNSILMYQRRRRRRRVGYNR